MPASARPLFDRAEQAARDLRFADALRDYRAALDADPSARFAPAARARAAHLAAHAEGDFVPLARLEAARRDPARLADLEAARAFEREVDAFPPGRVRAEARAHLSDVFRRLGDPDRAAAALHRILADEAADRLTRAVALGQLVALYRERGDLTAARDAADQHPDLAPSLRTEVHRLTRRVTLRWVAGGVLGAVALAAAGSLVWTRARRGPGLFAGRVVRPLAVAYALYLGAAAAVLARLHGGADPRPFLYLGLGVLGVDVAARSLRASIPGLRAPARAAWALCCVAGVLAVAFLALERADAGYLESFGL